MFEPYDIFISYKVEDREIVETIFKGLASNGIKVWYAKDKLQIGDEIRLSIKSGLLGARYGVSIISREYNSHWTVGELFILIGDKKFLPILHQITLEEACDFHPGLINIFCLNTNNGIENVIQSILKVVKPMPWVYYPIARLLSFTKKHLFRILLGVFIIAFAGISLYSYSLLRPPDSLVESVIKERCNTIQSMVQTELQQDIIDKNGCVSDLEQINRIQQTLETEHRNLKHKNTIFFTDGMETIYTVPKLINANIFSFPSMTEIPFGLSDYRVYIFNTHNQLSVDRLKFTFFNISPLHYEVIYSRIRDGVFEVEVQYANALRYVEVNIHADAANNTIYKQIKFVGVKPNEKIVFEKKGNNWEVLNIH